MTSKITQTHWFLYGMILSACFFSGNMNAADGKEDIADGKIEFPLKKRNVYL